MNPEQLLSQFDRLSNAPDAIPRLRRFILDLAVRGKLVEQDRRDEPASELLTRIQKEKALLVKAGKLKLLDPVLEISDQEKPFSTPSSWAWARLANTSRRIHYGFTASANQSLKTVRLLRITDIQNNLVDWSSVPGCEITADEVAQYRLDENDILIARTGGTIGKTFLVRQIPVTAVFASYLIRVQPSAELHAQYLKVFLESSVYWEQLQDGARGGGQPNVNGQTLGRMILPIPPHWEQYRIVTKVDELMALCDRLEATQRERESRRDRLVASSLNRLNNGAGPDAFRDHARFYFNHLPRLTTRTQHIQQLRQAILNLAVRGQLVSQDPNDEPASVLLKRIQAEKKRIAQAGEIRNEKSLPLIASENIPFDLPAGWEWTRWETIALKIGDIDHKMPETVTDGIPYVSPRDFLSGNRIDFDGAKQVSLGDFDRLSKKIKPTVGDLIYPRYGTIGENRLVTVRRDFLVSYSCAIVKVLGGFIDSKYQYLYSISPYCRQQAKAAENKATQANVGIKSIQEFLFPLPPLAEQHRIVAKVEELMGLCDRLEEQLTTTQTESRRLLEAVLH